MESGLVVEPVPEERYRELVDFIYREFFPREPLALASGLATKTNDGTVDSFLEWLRQDLSLMVIDPQTNRIVAAALNCFYKKAEPLFDSEYSCMAEEDRCIWKFIDHLKQGYDVFERLGVDQGMELVFLCVQESHVGRGFARRLTEETIELAKRRGIPFIKSHPSTPVTCHIFESLGFNTIREMKLVDFSLEGKPAFPHAKPEDITRFSLKIL